MKRHRKHDASWLGIWTPLGMDLVGFWREVGSQVGAKLAPKSGKLRAQEDVEKSSKFWSWDDTRWSATHRFSGPLKSYNTDNTDKPDTTDRQSKALSTHPSGRWPGGG